MKYNTDTFIKRAREVHGNRYDYSRVVYKRSTEKVEIICREHGPFFQRPENHINQKQDCPLCANERKGKQDHLSLEWVMKHPERAYAPCVLYANRVQTKTDTYIEVGISMKGVKYRTKPNSILVFFRYMSLKEALTIEDQISNNLKQYALNPAEFFRGKTRRLVDHPDVMTLLHPILWGHPTEAHK